MRPLSYPPLIPPGRRFLSTYWREMLIGAAIGIAVGCGAKYLAAAMLILWLLAGGQ